MTQESDYSVLRATRFFIPLAIQGISQSLTYPLVATVVTHGSEGSAGFGAFAQGQAVMFLMFAFGAGLTTTGMVFGRTRAGYDHFCRLNKWVTVAMVALQLACSLPPLDAIVFDKFLAIDPKYRDIARDSLLYCIPVAILFQLRNPHQALLYNGRASGQANAATLGRIVLTLCLSYAFVRFGLVGRYWGIACFTLPVVGEWLVSKRLARRFRESLPPGDPGTGRFVEQLLFLMPLSFGGVLLSLSNFMVAAFISRAVEPVRMQAVHYLAMGVVSPLSMGANRMQAVVLAFPPIDRHGTRTFKFACLAGAALAAVTWCGQIPVLAHWYFERLQNLPPGDVPLAMKTMRTACLIPFLTTLRSHAEGLAAWKKRPNAILAGQSVYLGILVSTLFFFLNLGVSGNIMGAGAMGIAVAASLATMRMGLAWSDFDEGTSKPTQRLSQGEAP